MEEFSTWARKCISIRSAGGMVSSEPEIRIGVVLRPELLCKVMYRLSNIRSNIQGAAAPAPNTDR